MSLKSLSTALLTLALTACGGGSSALTATLTLQTTAAPPRYQLATIKSDGTGATDQLYNASLTAASTSGRYVTFLSSSPIVPGGNQYHVYLRDLQAGTTELISSALDGTPGNASSEYSDVSEDGCIIVFDSYASNLVGGDTNGTGDVFVKTRCGTPQLVRLSVDGAGAEVNGRSQHPVISRDGRYVAYLNGKLGVVRVDLQTLVQVALTTQQTGDNPAISADGKRIAFYSYVPLTSNDTNGVWDIYLWDEATGGLTLVSTSTTGGQRNQGTESSSRVVAPSISGDGRFVSFATTSDNLVANDTNGASDVFVKDTQTGTLTLASSTESGTVGDSDSPSEQGGRAMLSLGGEWVVFETAAKNLTNGVGHRVVRHNVKTGKNVVVDAPADGYPGNRPTVSLDTHGRFVTFFSPTSLDQRFDASGAFRWDAHVPPTITAVTLMTLDSTLTLAASVDNSANTDFFSGTLPTLTWSWSQTQGPTTVSFDNAHSQTPQFSGAQPGVYMFNVKADDGVDSTTATVTVTVSAAL